MTKEEIIKNLRQKLRMNYEEYLRRLNAMAPPDLIEQAAEIAAAKRAYDLLTDGKGYYDTELLEYLLRFENPLEVVRDQWMTNHGFDPYDDMSVHLGHLEEKRLAEHKYQLETPPDQREGIQLC